MKKIKNILKFKVDDNSFNPFTGKYEDSFQFYDNSIETKKVQVYSNKTKSYHEKTIINNNEELWIDDKTIKTQKHVKQTKKTAVLSGTVVEVKEYNMPLFYNFDSKASGKKKTENEKRNSNINKSKQMLRRLINANVDYTDKFNNKFVTFTYANAEQGSDLKQCKNDFKTFIKRLKYHLSIKDLKWVYVTEIQHKRLEKYGDRVWHFHAVFFNLPFVDNKQLSNIWGFGSTDIHAIDNVDNVGSYVVKYMQKDSEEVQINSDLYGRSRGNLSEPLMLRDSELIDIIQNDLGVDRMVYSDTFERHIPDTNYSDIVTYKQYNYIRKNNN